MALTCRSWYPPTLVIPFTTHCGSTNIEVHVNVHFELYDGQSLGPGNIPKIKGQTCLPPCSRTLSLGMPYPRGLPYTYRFIGTTVIYHNQFFEYFEN
jgi:hypothetical protein